MIVLKTVQSFQKALCKDLVASFLHFFNHWYPRHALHSRWCYPDNVTVIGRRFGANVLLGKHIDAELTREEESEIADFGEIMLHEFGAKACEVQGAGPDQSAAIKADFADLLELLVTISTIMTY